MANQKISALTAATSITDDDLLVMVDDPSGTPATKKITKDNFEKSLALTADQISDGTTNKAYTAIEQSKLSGIATGATAYTDEMAQDAVGGMVNSTLTYTDGTPELKVTNPVTPQAVGFTISAGTTSKTLTVALDANVSGTNTGDQDLTGYVAKSTYDAQTILAATTDNTPAALTVGEQTVVGRITSGNIAALTVAQLQTLLFSSALGAEILMGENYSIKFDAALSADGKYCGMVRTGTAGATLAFGDLVYLAAADSRWELADADAASTAGDVLLGICVAAAANDGDATTILLYGFVRADTAFPALTISAPAYVSTTAGDIDTAQPTGTDDVIRRVGFAWTADELFFNPSPDYITHT